jgi:hypothetical protein
VTLLEPVGTGVVRQAKVELAAALRAGALYGY